MAERGGFQSLISCCWPTQQQQSPEVDQPNLSPTDTVRPGASVANQIQPQSNAPNIHTENIASLFQQCQEHPNGENLEELAAGIEIRNLKAQSDLPDVEQLCYVIQKLTVKI